MSQSIDRCSQFDLPCLQAGATSCILVLEGTRLVGLFTETDVVRLVASGVNLSKITMAEVMTQPPLILKQSLAQNIFTVLLLLRQYQIRYLPIVDELDRLIGLITLDRLLQIVEPYQWVSGVPGGQPAAMHLPLIDASEWQTGSEIAVYQLKRQTEQQRLVTEMAQRIRRSLNLNEILKTTVEEVRQFLQTDRVIIFRFQPDWKGTVIVESVGPTWPSILSMTIYDPCFEERFVEPYRQGRITAKADIYAAGLDECYIALLAQFQVRANLVVPILQGEQLWGLLIAHHCAAPRQWQSLEVDLLKQLATQVGIAIQQSELYQQAQIELLERKQTEVALRQSEERLSLALEAAHMGIWDWNIRTDSLVWSDRVGPMFGLPIGSHLPNHAAFLNFVYPDDRASVTDAIAQALKTGTKYEGEFRIVWLDGGTVRWVSSQGQIYADAAGTPIRMVGTLLDITDRKQAEADRRQISAALSNAVEGISQLDRQGHYIHVNQSYASTVGYLPAEMIGMTWWQTVHPDDLAALNAAYQQMLAAGKAEVEARGIRKDGSIFYKQLVMVAVHDEQKQWVGHYCFMKDISDRKRAEEALRQSEEKFRLVAAHTHSVIWIGSPESFDNLYVSPAYEKVWGRSCQSLHDRPQSWLEAVHPADRDLVMAKLGRQLQGQPTDLEYRIVRPDGEVRWVWDRGFAIPDETGKIFYYGGIAEDVTDRKQAEQRIHEQAALLNITSDAILVRDLEFQILFWNRGAEQLYGWTEAEAIGQNANHLLYQQVSPHLETALKTVVDQGEWQGELEKVTKSGRAILTASRWTLMRDAAGQPKSILSVDTDITERKHLETQFLRAQRLESLGTLASGIAHDLNNILTPILTTAQLLRLKFPDLDERNQQLLKLQEDSARRGADLVKQILSFARGLEGKKTALQVGHLLMEVVKIARSTFPKSIEVLTDIPIASLGIVLADATHLHQVFMNLCINARDAMPDGGTLSLSAENFHVDEHYARMNLDAQVGDYVVVTVADTGNGMPPKVLERIFEPFFTTKETGKGTGLGLATAIGIIKSHGGFVTVESEIGKGSRFRVYLPRAIDPATAPSEDATLPIGHGEKVLIVDDETTIQEITKTALQTYGYQAEVANDGIEALSLYVQHQAEIAAVLMDMVMPSMDGTLAIRTLQKINPQVKVIATSGRITSDRAIETLGAQVKAFLPKPYTIKELLETLDQVIHT